MWYRSQEPEARSQNIFVRLQSFGFLVPIFLFCNTAFAQDNRSVDRGLGFLAKTQNADGSFGVGKEVDERIRVTSVSLLAFLSAGHAPDLGKFGSAVRGATDYLMRMSASAKISTSERQAMLFALNQTASVDDNPSDQERIVRMMPPAENGMETIPSANDHGSVRITLQALMAGEQPKKDAAPLSYSMLYRISVLAADLHLDDVSQRIDAIMISRQRPDGSWEGDSESTALAVLSLTATDRLVAIGN